MGSTTHIYGKASTNNDDRIRHYLEKYVSSGNTYKVPTDVKYETTKRIFDVTVSLCVILFVLSWLMPIIAICIRISSKGPFMYFQQRIGLNGKPFTSLKFRTMYYDANNALFMDKKNDIRITPFGRFLRRTNLDELPQFMNVLLGDMSIVGPRPYNMSFAHYLLNSNEYKLLFMAKPGITSLASIRNNDNRGDVRRWVYNNIKYDVFYVKKRSINMDLKIVMLTIVTMVNGYNSEW